MPAPTRITRGPCARLDADSQAAILRHYHGGETLINGERVLTSNPLTYEYGASYDGVRITNAHDSRIVADQCEHCHRFDLRPKVAHSVDEAIEFGWIIPVE